MKIVTLALLVLNAGSALQAQQTAGQAASSPPPLPPGPWLKRVPVPSQWIVSFSSKSQEAAKPKPTPVETRAKRTVAVSKGTNIMVEVTTRQNGAITQRWHAGGLFLTQVGRGGDWIPSSGGPQNSFNDTDYSRSDFSGFDWISEKNYVGVRAIGKQQCLVFRDKVITMEPIDVEAIRSVIAQSLRDWQAKQEDRKAKAGSSPSAAPPPSDPAPRPFNIDDYKMIAEATIDTASGLPVMLSYQTERGAETRTYQFLPPPATPLSLPPEAQKFVDAERARLQRLSGPDAIP